MPDAPYSHRLRVAHLNAQKPTSLTLTPDAGERSGIAAALDLLDLPALSFDVSIAAAGHDAWELKGRLKAEVVQPCVVTLAPVQTPIDEEVRRVYSPHAADPQPDTAGAEVEMPDDEIEPLGQYIDVGAVLTEALALSLPLYPRAEGAELDAAEDEQDEEEARRPFAGLAELLARKDEN